MKNFLLTISIFLLSISLSAQNYWKRTSLTGKKIRSENINLPIEELYTVDFYSLKKQLKSSVLRETNQAPTIVYVPTSEGKIERFSVYHAPVIDEEIENKYELYSYAGIGLDDTNKYIRFSISPNQFNSMIMDNTGIIQLIDPYTTDGEVYSVRIRKKNSFNDFNCNTVDEIISEESNSYKIISSDRKFRTYRLALSVTGEYTQHFGGVTGALQQINITMTRVNGILERDLSVNLKMINNISLIYEDPNTDPYSDASFINNWNMELQKTLTAVVGEDNYDIGHLFGGNGGGGNAGCIGCICVSPKMDPNGIPTSAGKGSGITSPSNNNPSGDHFDIDYVAHEMGHQLGANHTFSCWLENTGVNIEPGSGSTIMGYAGITSANVQLNSDAYFHSASIQQINKNLQPKTCGTINQIPNHPPVVNVGPSSVTIPIGTRFYLDAEGTTDPDGDELTFCWEQIDNARKDVIRVDSSQTYGPIFRSFLPTTSTRRYFPALTTGIYSPNTWETVSNVKRALNFTVTVRDNNPNKPQTKIVTKEVMVSDSGGPFIATFPTANYIAKKGSSIKVAWNVANTTAQPFNTQYVNISLVTDEGQTITPLADHIPNTGNATVDLPADLVAKKAKIMIEASNNIYFALTEYFSIGYESEVICKKYMPNFSSIPIPDGNGDHLNSDFATMGIIIPENENYDELINLQVSVDIDHPNIFDLYIVLQDPGPDYKSTVLWNHSCEYYSDLKVTFDDNGAAVNCSSPTTGTIKPRNAIHSLYKKKYSGEWLLGVADHYANDVGTLNSFSLNLCSLNYKQLQTDENFSEIPTFKVYPNPSEGVFTIDLGAIQFRGNTSHVKVYNLAGSLLFSKVEKNKLFSIDLTNYSAGIYTINITGNGNSISKNVIKK
ncbi:reprolysin-like metallopeptidase [Apibacter mensalis]|uniref:zinc-dependent metalloprotease n=1 Tax=Apibacter mensalis TaxID=1586267 RepID=UPI0026EE5C23|nr:zinc-dependent metalloprotease family protein [Apibacter mensalis]